MTSREINNTSFYPRSLSDTLNGDASERGAMAVLANLIHDQSTPGLYQCRPAVKQISPMYRGAATVSQAIESNSILYGMVNSGNYPGKDEPFAYDIAHNIFLTITGVFSTNLPNSQPLFGDWTPPSMVENAQKVVVAHPGFHLPIAFGYLDFTNFTTALSVTTTSGSNILNGAFSLSGIGPGYNISGTNIPSGTTVTDTGNVAFNTTGDTHTSTTIDNIPNTTGMFVGQNITGNGIPAGTTIASVIGVNSITISQATIGSNIGIEIFITGNTLTLSQNATGSGQVTVTIAGGTSSSPLWCAGNTTQKHLQGVAQTVGAFNTRFWFSVDNAETFTDTNSLNVTLATQTLFMGDATPVIAVSPMPLSTVSQAIIEGLIIYKKNQILQITGDASTSDLAVNEMSANIGCLAPNSVAVCPDGTRFMATDGIRTIQLSGIISDPDRDLAIPFISTPFPSRTCGAYNNNIYRISIQVENTSGLAYQDFWYDLKNGGWTGPHTFPYDVVVSYQNTFLLASNSFAPGLYQSDVVLGQNGLTDNFSEYGTIGYTTEDGTTLYVAEDGVTQYVTESNLLPVFYVAEDGITQYVAEDGVTNYITENLAGPSLQWEYQTSLMTDNHNIYANTLINSTIEMVTASLGNPIQFTAFDQNDAQLDQVTILEQAGAPIWGEVNWGAFIWGEQNQGLGPITIPWDQYFEFNRVTIDVVGTSDADVKIGPLHITYAPLNYLLK